MILLIKALTEQFKEILKESHYLNNNSVEVRNPYLTFSISGEPLRFKQDGFYIDVDVFDNQAPNDVRIETVVQNVKEHFENKHVLTEQFLLQFEFRISNHIPTGSDTLQRRNLQLYVKVDWRG